MTKAKTCLWFKNDAEAAIWFYVALLPGSRVEHVQRSPGPWPGGETGDVIVVDFTLGGPSFQALNGGAAADYGTAASISVECADQAEVDRLRAALAVDGGSEIACGWLRDRWGVPWHVGCCDVRFGDAVRVDWMATRGTKRPVRSSGAVRATSPGTASSACPG